MNFTLDLTRPRRASDGGLNREPLTSIGYGSWKSKKGSGTADYDNLPVSMFAAILPIFLVVRNPHVYQNFRGVDSCIEVVLHATINLTIIDIHKKPVLSVIATCSTIKCVRNLGLSEENMFHLVSETCVKLSALQNCLVEGQGSYMPIYEGLFTLA